MPLPIWLIPVALKGAAVVAGAAGVGAAAHGAKKMKDANDTMKAAQSRHERNVARFENENETTTKDMDKLGKLELEILHSFSEFSDVFEQIKNRPTFETYSKNGVKPIPDNTQEATVCPPPGIPAIPKELTVTTIIVIK